MRLTQWSALKGKKLTMLVTMGTSLGGVDVRCTATCHSIPQTRDIPILNLDHIKFLDVSKHYAYVKTVRFLGQSEWGRGIDMSKAYGARRLLYSLSLKKGEVTSINGTRLEHLYGPNLRNWPLIALKLKSIDKMFSAAKKDRQLSDLIHNSLDNRATNEDFLKALALCRTAKRSPEVQKTPLEECLSELFHI